MFNSKPKLTIEQEKAVLAALDNRNIFITGTAGTGKSFLIAELVQQLQQRNRTVKILALTGSAAHLIGATTIHSFAKLAPKPRSMTFADYSKNALKKVRKEVQRQVPWKLVDTIIVDEVHFHPSTLLTSCRYLWFQGRCWSYWVIWPQWHVVRLCRSHLGAYKW